MKAQRAIVIDVDPEKGLSSELESILEACFRVDCLAQQPPDGSDKSISMSSFAELIRRSDPLVIFLVLTTFSAEHRTILEFIRKEVLNVPVIAVIDGCEPQRVFELLKLGVTDFVTSPLTASDVLPRIWRFVKEPDNGNTLKQTPRIESGLHRLIGRSQTFLTQLKKIPQIARCRANVLISGETGTGKELYARAIHYSSARAGKPFMPVNCGAIPVELLENELFGHERGAFTSALTLKTGLIEEANNGTLFLDEIDCLPVIAQVKLLRFLQEKEYKPLGSTKMRRADVRIIAASNLDLKEAVDNGTIRQDLFYRLNIISLTLPPLRDRREDIPLLTRHFLAKYSTEFDKETAELSRDALDLLMVHSWPGNVRELEHVIERAVALCEGSTIRGSDLVIASQAVGRPESLQEAKAREIARFEKNYIQGLLSACSGNITRAAQVAQKNRRAFWQLIHKHRIDVSRFKPTTP